MPASIIKEVRVEITPILTKMMNLSLQSGIFAESWKLSIVRPLLKKKGLETDYKNYRPVTNVGFISKLAERMALCQYQEHVDNNQLLPAYQSAYRKHYSCETALIKLFNDCLWCMERQEVSALCAIDLSAAFDTVDHDTLLAVLRERFGLRGTVLNWFDTYLRPRDFRVNIGNSYSQSKELGFSVPQGSCCGPQLYSAYASTMQVVVNTDKITLYGLADDHALRTSFRASNTADETTAVTSLEDCLCDIKTRMDSNRLRMNDAKTEFLLIGSRQQLGECDTQGI
jgi:hypothetical protein